MKNSYDIPELLRQRALQKYDPYRHDKRRPFTRRHLWKALFLTNAVWVLLLGASLFAVFTVAGWYWTQRSMKIAEMEHSRQLESEINRLARLHSYSTTQTMKLAEDIQSVLDTANGTRREFLENMLPHALRLQALYRIPASATIGMSIYESGYGRSDLARRNNNYFGIKAFRDWNGPRVNMPTVDLGQRVRADFRAYGSLGESVQGYADFLRNRSRYQKAFRHYQGDAFVGEVARAGYCPDADYTDQVSKIIRRHNLQILDLPPESPMVTLEMLADQGLPGLIEWPRLELQEVLNPVPGDSVMSRPAERQIVLLNQ
ncbi:MAG: glucosaminidase domain-containing protein [Verrucomicrobiota bacterium]